MAENTAKSCSRFRSQKLEFLRVLVPNPFAKLRIPGKVAKSLRNEPHKRATLYIRPGKFWHVGIQHEGDNMYLDEGWKEFAEALNLRTGYFVLFRYEVNMVFSVKIFDNTMCLKEYVHDSSKRPIQDLYEDSVRTVGVRCTEDNMYCSPDSSCKRQKLETNHIVKREQGKEKREERINKENLKTSPLSPSFPRFVKIIKSYHSTRCLGIPKNFCIRHGLVSERELFLVNTTGKSWPVQLFLTLCDGKLKGFRDFARDNGLREGDRCTFQLVKQNTFLVHVMAPGAEKQQYSPIFVQNNVDLLEVSEFERVVSRCYLHNIYIPTRVRKAIGLVSDCRVVLMNQEGRSWPVEFIIKSNGEGHLGSGWGRFLRGNNIKEGDRCIFKLIEKNVLLVNVVHKESTGTICKDMHALRQVPNKKIVSTKDCLSSVLLEKAFIEERVNNANGPLTSSVVEVPSIEAQEELHNSINYLNPTVIEKVQSIEMPEAQKNVSSVYVEKAPSTEAQKEKAENNSCSSSTGNGKLIKAPEAAQKNMISVCVEKAPCIEAEKQIVQNTTNGLSSTRIEKISVNEQKKSSSVYVEKKPSTEAQKERLQNNNRSSSTCIEKVRLIEAPEAQKKLITVCVEKTLCVKAQKEIGWNNANSSSLSIIENTPIEEQKKSNSVRVAKDPSTDGRKEKAENNNCSSSTGIEKVQLIEAPEAQKKLVTVCVEKTPCIKAQKEIERNNANSLNSTSIENTPIEEQKKSHSVRVAKDPSTDGQKEKAENNNCSSSTGIEKVQLIEAPEAQKMLITVCVENLPCIEAHKEIGWNNTNSLSSTVIENTPIEEQKKSSSVCVAKAPSTDGQNEKVEKREKGWSLPCVKRPLIEVREVQQKMGEWSSKRFPKIEKMIQPYNVHHNYVVLSKEFCSRSDLHSPRRLILKDSDSKTWQVNYRPNNGRGSLSWKKFINDKKMKVGDKCIFKLVAHDTLLVNIVRK